jgi:hypothetical protein
VEACLPQPWRRRIRLRLPVALQGRSRPRLRRNRTGEPPRHKGTKVPATVLRIDRLACRADANTNVGPRVDNLPPSAHHGPQDEARRRGLERHARTTPEFQLSPEFDRNCYPSTGGKPHTVDDGRHVRKVSTESYRREQNSTFRLWSCGHRSGIISK